jgi:hypothetical protein
MVPAPCAPAAIIPGTGADPGWTAAGAAARSRGRRTPWECGLVPPRGSRRTPVPVLFPTSPQGVAKDPPPPQPPRALGAARNSPRGIPSPKPPRTWPGVDLGTHRHAASCGGACASRRSGGHPAYLWFEMKKSHDC